MDLPLDTLFSTLIYGGVLVFCGYHLGRKNDEEKISNVIDWLIDEGYVKHQINMDGEVELIKLNEYDR
jgi:hypothetical protein